MNKQQLIAAVLLALSSVAGAQSLKPGLWEVTQTTQTAGGEMDKAMAGTQKEVANMPTDQRKMMQDMMDRQAMQRGEGGGMRVRMCMTQDMIDRNELAPQRRNDCTTSVQPRSGNTTKMSFSCTNPHSSGEGQMTFTSPEAYSMKMMVNTKVDGQMQQVSMDSSGKWLGSDCGNIRPIK
jgi:hypothetical protein